MLSADRYFGSTLYILAFLYHERVEDQEERESLAEAYRIVESFQRERWGEDAPRSIEDAFRGAGDD